MPHLPATGMLASCPCTVDLISHCQPYSFFNVLQSYPSYLVHGTHGTVHKHLAQAHHLWACTTTHASSVHCSRHC
jgi:hypothetical protein